MRAFTKKREGPASDALFVSTDSAAPAAPAVSNITCHENGDIQIEWHRPAIVHGEYELEGTRIHIMRVRMLHTVEKTYSNAKSVETERVRCSF